MRDCACGIVVSMNINNGLIFHCRNRLVITKGSSWHATVNYMDSRHDMDQ